MVMLPAEGGELMKRGTSWFAFLDHFQVLTCMDLETAGTQFIEMQIHSYCAMMSEMNAFIVFLMYSKYFNKYKAQTQDFQIVEEYCLSTVHSSWIVRTHFGQQSQLLPIPLKSLICRQMLYYSLIVLSGLL